MVADKVTLLTRRAGEDHATRWESTGEGTYTLEHVNEAPQGSSVTLHLMPEDSENGLHDYTSGMEDQGTGQEVLRLHRVAYPHGCRSYVDAGRGRGARGHIETETINSMKALWDSFKDEVSEDEYKEFYKHVSHAWDELSRSSR